MNQATLRSVVAAIRAVFAHGAEPGYRQLNRRDRLRVDALAAWQLLTSWHVVRLLYVFAIWLLAGYTLVWQFDWRGAATTMPPLSALCWLLPWLAALRKAALRRALAAYWRAPVGVL